MKQCEPISLLKLLFVSGTNVQLERQFLPCTTIASLNLRGAWPYKKIGQAHLYYLMLITPIVALAVSSLFEDDHWSVYSTLGSQ